MKKTKNYKFINSKYTPILLKHCKSLIIYVYEILYLSHCNCLIIIQFCFCYDSDTLDWVFKCELVTVTVVEKEMIKRIYTKPNTYKYEYYFDLIHRKVIAVTHGLFFDVLKHKTMTAKYNKKKKKKPEFIRFHKCS